MNGSTWHWRESSYFASWIANFGVVPLLRFSAFLLAPIFFFLFLRIVLVLFVKDPITIYLNILTTVFQQQSAFIAAAHQIVKGPWKISPILLLLVISNSYGSSPPTRYLVLAKGEQHVLKMRGLQKYSIGNKEVLKSKLHQQKLLLKGEQVGFSDLVLWDKEGEQHFKIYILSKKSQLKTLKMADVFTSMGLTWSLEGGIVAVKGSLKQRSHWKLLNKMRSKYAKELFLEVSLQNELSNQVVADIYQHFYKAGAQLIQCQLEGIDLYCEVHGTREALQAYQKRWQSKLPVHFNYVKSLKQSGNFRLKLHLVKIMYHHDGERRFGLEKLESTVNELLATKGEALIGNNAISIQDNVLKVQTIARPEVTLAIGEQANVQVGQEVPIRESGFFQRDRLVEWKFMGLKIHFTLTSKEDNFFLQYKLSFSRPNDEGIGQSEESAKLYITTRKRTKLFTLDFQTSGKEVTQLPILSQVPLLGALFRGYQDYRTQHHMMAYITLEKEDS